MRRSTEQFRGGAAAVSVSGSVTAPIQDPQNRELRESLSSYPQVKAQPQWLRAAVVFWHNWEKVKFSSQEKSDFSWSESVVDSGEGGRTALLKSELILYGAL